MSFGKWIDTYLEEKCIDSEETLTVEGPSGENIIPVGCLVEKMKSAPAREQSAIKSTLVRIDVVNGDVRHFLRHLATAVAL